MRFDVVTLFPELVGAVLEHGVIGRAARSGLLKVNFWNPRDYADDRYRQVDDRPYGGGPGMVMMAQPLVAALGDARAASADEAPVLYLSPQGRRLDQRGVGELSRHRRVILLAGRYEGVDERVVDSEVDEEWSIGDYVLSGGELAVMVLIDAIARILPGVLGHEDSAREDSFCDGLLDYPHYTRPEVFASQAAPRVLLSGDHEAIRRWRLRQALGRTWLKRPDLLAHVTLTGEQQELLSSFKEIYRQENIPPVK